MCALYNPVTLSTNVVLSKLTIMSMLLTGHCVFHAPHEHVRGVLCCDSDDELPGGVCPPLHYILEDTEADKESEKELQ